jgi:hypothetical protein
MCFDTRPQSDEAIAAYRKFLTGAQLNETPLGGSYRKRASVLQRRMRVLSARIEDYQRRGGEMSLNEPRVKRPEEDIPEEDIPEEDIKDGRLDAMTRELGFIDATMSSNLRVKSTLNRRGQAGAHSRFPSNELQPRC